MRQADVMRYVCETAEYTRTTTAWTPHDCDPARAVMCGRHAYVDRLACTEADEVAPDLLEADPDNQRG